MSDGFFQVPKEDDNNTGAVVAIVVVVFLLVLLLSGAGVASYRKVRSCRRRAANKLYEQQQEESNDEYFYQETPAPAESSESPRPLGTSADVAAAKKDSAAALAEVQQMKTIAASMAACTQKTANACITEGTYCAMKGGMCQPDYSSKNLPSKFTTGPEAHTWVNELRSMVESAEDKASWKRMQSHAEAMESQAANQLIVGHCKGNPSITCNSFNAQKAAHCGATQKYPGVCDYDLSKQAGYNAYCTGMVKVTPGSAQAKGTCCDPSYVSASHANMMHCAADYVEWNGVQKGSSVEVVSAALNALGKEPFQKPYVTEYSSQLSWPTKTAPGTVTQASFPAMCGNMTAATGDYVTYPEDGVSVDAYPVPPIYDEVYNSLVADSLPVSRAGSLGMLSPQLESLQGNLIKN